MRNYFFAATLFLLLATGCKKQAELVSNDAKANTQTPAPRCGMEAAVANMVPGYLDEVRSRSTNLAATELLVFLDFDGAVVRRGFPNSTGLNSSIIPFSVANCPPSALTAADIAAVVEYVKDAFSPFEILVTTDQSVFNSYPAFNKEICIISTVPAVLGMSSGVGGVSPFIGLGTRLPSDPSFVFANLYYGDLPYIASTIAHEVGHTLGLGHQSQYSSSCAYIYEYNLGFGTGPLSFGPIMGEGGKRMSNWFAQPCINPFSGGPQDDFALINSQVSLKDDDFPDQPTGNTISGTGELNGILGKAGDVDFIKINFQNLGPVYITCNNIDIKASVYNNGGHLVAEYNDPDDIQVTIPSVNGLRYLKIEAVSNVNMSAQFMTGKYRIMY